MSHEELIEYAVKVNEINENLDTKLQSIVNELEVNLSQTIEVKLDEKLSQIVDQKLAILKTELLDEFSQKIITFEQVTKDSFEKLESELQIVKTVNTTLSAQLINTQKEAHRTAQYTQYETVEFSGIPTQIDNSHIGDVVRSISKKIGVNLATKEIQACHWGKGKRSKAVFCKIS